ncbi:hypothetical protein V6N11_031527 [Hibiscus sabdariffa]|uniref:Uncharacterized protein n=1 Tax=Hibiscus sabdariffa TaxID=183260 RepID=A0ABR2SXW3_9ROSI
MMKEHPISAVVVCKGSTLTDFTIHGLWPQDGQNIGVPPYAKSSNCTTLTVVPTSQLRTMLRNEKSEGPLTQV